MRDRNQINKPNALTEKGDDGQRRRRHAEPARHAHRLGFDGRAIAGTPTRRATTGRATPPPAARMLGHHDRTGGGNTSWNSAHASRGCSQDNLVATGGAGLFYCFAAN